MKVKTILYSETGFWISPQLYNDANYYFYNPTVSNFNREYDFRYIGSPGWYGSEDNKRIYQELIKLTDLTNWYTGEFIEVDFDILIQEANNASL